MPSNRDRNTDRAGFWRGVGRGIVDSLPKPGNLRNWRQVLDVISEPWVPGNLYDSARGGTVGENVRGRASDTFDRLRGLLPDGEGEPLPGWMTPGAPIPSPPDPGNWAAGLPNYNQDQTYAGPPSPSQQPYGQGQGVFPMPSAPRGPVGPSRNNRTIAEGDAAVDWARGVVMANSGLNASGGTFDELNRRARGMQR